MQEGCRPLWSVGRWVHFIALASRKIPYRSYLGTRPHCPSVSLLLLLQRQTTDENDCSTGHNTIIKWRDSANDLTTICSVFIALSSLSVVGFIDFQSYSWERRANREWRIRDGTELLGVAPLVALLPIPRQEKCLRMEARVETLVECQW